MRQDRLISVQVLIVLYGAVHIEIQPQLVVVLVIVIIYFIVPRLFGTSVFTFSLIHPATNFIEEFKTAFPGFVLNLKELAVLEAFTKYELAVMEQAYLIRFKPLSNANHTSIIQSSHSIWLGVALVADRGNSANYYMLERV